MDEGKRETVRQLRAIAVGDHKAFDELYASFRDVCENMIRNIAPLNIADEYLDDIYQEVMLYLWEKKDGIDLNRDDVSIFTWFTTTVKGVIKNNVKRIIRHENRTKSLEELPERKTSETETIPENEMCRKIKEIGLKETVLKLGIAKDNREADIIVSLLEGWEAPQVRQFFNVDEKYVERIRVRLRSLKRQKLVKEKLRELCCEHH